MGCSITYGWPQQCRDNIGGVKNVYIGQFTNDFGFISASSSITSFTGATVSFYTFNQPLQTAEFNEAGAYSTENGTAMYTQTVTITLQKLSATSTALINSLGQGIWRIICLDNNGKYWLIGAQFGARVSAATPNRGKALGDLNGAIITFEAMEPLSAYEITAGGLTGTINIVANSSNVPV